MLEKINERVDVSADTDTQNLTRNFSVFLQGCFEKLDGFKNGDIMEGF